MVEALRAAGCVYAQDEAALILAEAATAAEQTAMVDRRVAGEPLEHVLGWAAFGGLRIAVGPGVFVPRRRTELLVREAAALVRAARRAARTDAADPVVLDLCCGSGAVGAALAAVAGPVQLYAADVDPVAVGYARRNLGASGRVYLGDLDAPLPAGLRGRVDVVVANVPYVPTGAVTLMPREAREHEPRVALDGGADGLEVLRRVCAAAPRWLVPGGHLLIETSAEQEADAVAAFAAHGLGAAIVRDDDLGATVLVGVWPPDRPRT